LSTLRHFRNGAKVFKKPFNSKIPLWMLRWHSLSKAKRAFLNSEQQRPSRNELLESHEGSEVNRHDNFEWKGFVKTFARIRIGASLSFFGQKKRNL
jgi:hypothetical protein